MSDLIRRQDALDAVETVMLDGGEWYAEAIKDIPSADAVEVVRCKDCIFYEKALSVQGFCHNHESIVYVNDFCSYGERRTDD